MDFNPSQTQFGTFAQWQVWAIAIDLAPAQAETAWHRYYRDLLADLYQNPKAYALPEDPYIYLVDDQDKAAEARLRESALKIRKAVVGNVLDFLFRLGQLGQPLGETLCIDRAAFDALLAEKLKKSKNKAFLACFERLGLRFAMGEQVVVTNEQYPGMLTLLADFSKACAQVKDFDEYLFRRADFAVFNGKTAPAIEDVVQLVPPELRADFLQTDAFLAGLKFKCEIFAAGAGNGYRVRYSRKGDKIVYWSRVRFDHYAALVNNLRWPLGGDLTPRLFAALDETHPGLADRVFAGFWFCKHCFPNCGGRHLIERCGQTAEVCSETAWGPIDLTPTGFEAARKVAQTLNDLI